MGIFSNTILDNTYSIFRCNRYINALELLELKLWALVHFQAQNQSY